MQGDHNYCLSRMKVDFRPARRVSAQYDFSANNYGRNRAHLTKKFVAKLRRNLFHFFDKELRQPPSLQELARRVINECVTIHRASRLDELEPPKILKKKLRDFIEIDCFWCLETIPKNVEEMNNFPIRPFSIIACMNWNNKEDPPKLLSREMWRVVDWKHTLIDIEYFNSD